MKKGNYKAIKDCRFRVGVSSIGISEGVVVKVIQVDTEYSKVLVDFGGGDSDWIGFHSLTKNFEALQ